MSAHRLDFVFHPKSIAVVGASDNPAKWGYFYLRHFLDYGYQGTIYPVSPNRSKVLGLKAYPSLAHVPGSIDYVVSCIPLDQTPQLLTRCSQKGAKLVHIFAGRASETGRKEALELDKEILKRARRYDIRLLGPNCLGIYYPQVGLSTGYNFPKKPGPIGVLSQSGSFCTDLIRFGSLRGLGFSKVISYGNALDLNESDFLDYLSQDPETSIILAYVEGVKDGERFLNALRNAARSKPLILVKGGRSSSGTRAIASHTASLTSPIKMWEVALRQAGAIPARNLDELIDLAVSFCFLPPIKGARVGMIGGGGGRSVLSADECEELGLNVIPLPQEVNEEIREKDPAMWKWLGNPVDMSIMVGSAIDVKYLLSLMIKAPDFDFLIANVTEDYPLNQELAITHFRSEIEAYIGVSNEGLKPLAVVLSDRSLGIEDMSNWRWNLYAELRTQLLDAHVPFYPSTGRAAKAIKELITYYQRNSQVD